MSRLGPECGGLSPGDGDGLRLVRGLWFGVTIKEVSNNKSKKFRIKGLWIALIAPKRFRIQRSLDCTNSSSITLRVDNSSTFSRIN